MKTLSPKEPAETIADRSPRADGGAGLADSLSSDSNPAGRRSGPDLALRIVGLRKSFGSLQAIRGVSFDLIAGERLAFLGPNGAGKTTLIRCLSGRTKPDAGSIELFGRPIGEFGVREAIGLVPQEIAIYPDLTTRENLDAFGRFHGLRGRELKQRVGWALQWTGLEDRAGDLCGGFSGGMKRRVNLACGVLHEPRLLLLDEPTVGVDPQSREKIFSMLDELNASGTTILLTTHHLDEAEKRSDRIVIVDQGQVVADGTIDQLIHDSVGASRMVRLRFDRQLDQPLPISSSGATIGNAGDDHIRTRIGEVSEQLPRLLMICKHHGYDVIDVEVQAPSLHHVFLHLTGHELRD